MTFTQEIEQHNKLIKDLKKENRLLGERCNQLLKDKGDLTDELDNQTVAYETLKLHDQEEIGMLNSKVTELEKENEYYDHCAEEVDRLLGK